MKQGGGGGVVVEEYAAGEDRSLLLSSKYIELFTYIYSIYVRARLLTDDIAPPHIDFLRFIWAQ